CHSGAIAASGVLRIAQTYPGWLNRPTKPERCSFLSLRSRGFCRGRQGMNPGMVALLVLKNGHCGKAGAVTVFALQACAEQRGLGITVLVSRGAFAAQDQ